MSVEITQYNGDVMKLLPLAVSWKQECNAEKFGMNADVTRFMASVSLLAKNDFNVVITMTDGDLVVGILVMSIAESYFGNDRFAEDKFWYVMPQYRGRKSIKMIDVARLWAESKGCTHIVFNATDLASDMHDRVCEIYEHIGMKRLGTMYVSKVGGK